MTIRIGVISDLHLDHYKNEWAKKICDRLLEQCQDIDVLVNAGDVCNGPWFRHSIAKAFFEAVETKIPVVHVRGNHDYYSDDLTPCMRVYQIKETPIAAATLWTDCHDDPAAMLWFKQHMYDSTLINGFTIAAMLAYHQEQKKFVLESNAEIVVTHNPPTMLSVAPRFKAATIANKAFIPNMDKEVAASKVKLWLHGHTHSEHDYDLNGTRVVCHPLGYPGELYSNPMEYSVKVIEL